MEIIRRFFAKFSREAQYQRMQREMHDYLSQAHDRLELEWLQREWDRRYGSRMIGLSLGGKR